MKKYSRRSVIKSGTIAAFGFSPFLSSFNKAFGNPTPVNAATGDLLLWYRKPAEKWLEALPIGNGKLGGMVFGGAAQERISVSEDTLWTGGPYHAAQDVSPETMASIRKLSFEGLKIRSTLGGNLRLQVPNEVAVQKVKGIQLASGANPNPLFAAIDMPAALIVPNSPIQQIAEKKTWVYDIPTEKGKVYELLFA